MEVRKKHFLPTAVHYYEKPLQLVKAKGQYVWDEKDNKYLDAIGGVVCISAGHMHPKIKEGIKSLLDEDIVQHTSYLFLNRYTAEASEKLLEYAPESLDRVAFTNSGSEANELALMIARNVTGTQTVINLTYAYHGGTAQTLNHCGQSGWKFSHQVSGGSLPVPAPYCYRCPYGKQRKTCGLQCAKEVKNAIQMNTSGKVAAMIIEPILGAGGFIEVPKDYLYEVQAILKSYGAKLIIDEVQTGAGRTGEDFFYTKHLNIDADAVTTAKGLGNGAPIAAALFRTDMVECMERKIYFNTYAGDTYQALQASLTMDIIKEESLIQNTKEQGTKIKAGLEELAKKYSIIGDVRGQGLLLGIELVKDRQTKEPASEECMKFMDLCKERGLLVGKGGLFGHVVRIAPPLNFQADNVEEMLNTMDHAFKQLLS